MLPPRHVLTANVRNATAESISLTITYEMPLDKAHTTSELTVEPNATVAVEQKLVEQETCTFTANIISIAAKRSGDAEAVKLDGPYNVNSPTKDHPFTVEVQGEQLIVREGH